MEKIRDLLDYCKKNLKVFEHRSGGTSIDGAREVTVDLNLSTITPSNSGGGSSSAGPGAIRPAGAATATTSTTDPEATVLRLMEQGALNLAKGATGFNEGSSRSHSIVIPRDWGVRSTKEGKLYMVDLIAQLDGAKAAKATKPAR